MVEQRPRRLEEPGPGLGCSLPAQKSEEQAVVYQFTWTNPRPAVAIATIDLEYGDQGSRSALRRCWRSPRPPKPNETHGPPRKGDYPATVPLGPEHRPGRWFRIQGHYKPAPISVPQSWLGLLRGMSSSDADFRVIKGWFLDASHTSIHHGTGPGAKTDGKTTPRPNFATPLASPVRMPGPYQSLIRVNEAIGQGLLELFQLLHPKANLEVLQRLSCLTTSKSSGAENDVYQTFRLRSDLSFAILSRCLARKLGVLISNVSSSGSPCRCTSPCPTIFVSDRFSHFRRFRRARCRGNRPSHNGRPEPGFQILQSGKVSRAGVGDLRVVNKQRSEALHFAHFFIPRSVVIPGRDDCRRSGKVASAANPSTPIEVFSISSSCSFFSCAIARPERHVRGRAETSSSSK